METDPANEYSITLMGPSMGDRKIILKIINNGGVCSYLALDIMVSERGAEAQGPQVANHYHNNNNNKRSHQGQEAMRVKYRPFGEGGLMTTSRYLRWGCSKRP